MSAQEAQSAALEALVSVLKNPDAAEHPAAVPSREEEKTP